MIRKATMQDVPRIAEIIVFGKRVAYRPIFNNDVVSFNELQVINVIEEYRNNPTLVDKWRRSMRFTVPLTASW